MTRKQARAEMDQVVKIERRWTPEWKEAQCSALSECQDHWYRSRGACCWVVEGLKEVRTEITMGQASRFTDWALKAYAAQVTWNALMTRIYSGKIPWPPRVPPPPNYAVLYSPEASLRAFLAERIQDNPVPGYQALGPSSALAALAQSRTVFPGVRIWAKTMLTHDDWRSRVGLEEDTDLAEVTEE